MRDDTPVPPEHDAGREALERDLRALFAPTAAPRRFRQQLKSELLRDQRARIALPLDARTGSRLAWLGAHRRTAITISSALAIAAALLLTAAIRGLTIAPASTLRAGAPPHPSHATATHTPAVAIVPVQTATTPPSPTAGPTHTPIPGARHRHHSGTRLMPRKTAVLPPRRHHRAAATVTPEPTATVAVPTATVASGAAPAATATMRAIPPAPPSTATATPSLAPSATPTAPPARPATPQHSTQPPHPAPTATPTTKALTLPALRHTPAPAVPTATPSRHRREPSPTATPTVTLPALGVKIALPPAPRATATLPLAPPPLATASPTPSATPRPTSTARPTPSATPQPSAAPSATASPTNTPPPIVLNPLAQPYGLPVPNAGNGILSSPLNGAVPYAQQPVSYSVATTLTLAAPQELPVYPLTTTDVTVVDALTIARQVGATGILSGPATQPDGSLLATVQIETLRYTLDVFGGAGTPWFTLHAIQSAVGHATPARVTAWADAWLHAHALASPDLRLLSADGDTASYGQNVSGLPLLGPVAVQLRFDGRGALHDMSYAYIRPTANIPSALQSPALAAAAAIDQGQGLYQGPSASTVSGPATVAAVTLAYVGVHGIHNYLEPVYVLSGTAPTASGTQPFSLYASALQYAAPTPTPAATP